MHKKSLLTGAALAVAGRALLPQLLLAKFRRIHRTMANNNLRQAYLIEGAEALPNAHGSAPGQLL